MLSPRSHPRWTRTAGAGLLSGTCIAAACQVQQPVLASAPVIGAPYALPVAASAVQGEVSGTKQANPAEAMSTGPRLAPQRPTIVPSPAAEMPAVRAPAQTDPLQAMMRMAVQRYYPNLLTERIAAGRVNLYLIADARGEIVKHGTDTGQRNGNCLAILQARLGPLDFKEGDVSGCGRLVSGTVEPNEVHYFFAALKPSPGEENAPATGPFRFAEVVKGSRPSEAVLRAAVERHYPEVMREGLPFGEQLWFVVDPPAGVLHTGRGLIYATSVTAKADLEKKFPGTRIGGALMASLEAANGKNVSLVWATVAEPGSVAAPTPTPGSDPLAYAQAFPVVSEPWGQEVRIELQGEAARVPNAFRLHGPFSRQGNVLVTRTPFILAVPDLPFVATLTPAKPDVEIQLMSEGRLTDQKGVRLSLTRELQGGAVRVYVIRGPGASQRP